MTSDITPEENRLIQQWEERMAKKKETEDKKAAEEAEKLRQDYLRRRVGMKRP